MSPNQGTWATTLFVSSIPLLASLLAFLGAVWTYVRNEKDKRAYEYESRREYKYWYLLQSMRGFYSPSLDPKLQAEFALQVASCWMYCPDEMVRKVYAFVDAVIADGDSSDSRKQQAEAELMAAIRQDSYGKRFRQKTTLTASDYRSLWGLRRLKG
jgi:hypothetical protein